MPGRLDRRIARTLAFQALYSWNVAGADIDTLLTFSWLETDFAEKTDSTASDDEDDTPQYSLFDKQLEIFHAMSEEKKQEIFAFARMLVQGTIENLSEIDGLIKTHLSSNWTIDRINKVSLAVIRLSVYALLYQKDIDSSIVIDEAVEIVKDYGVDDSHKFTNAILDKINKDISA